MQANKGILYISTHQSPFYPGTGRAEERGLSGNIVNIELPAGTEGTRYRAVFSRDVMPALEDFRPELLCVSAGFDAHKDDPIAYIKLVEDDYAWIGQQLHGFTQKFCNSQVISILEGGYNHDILAASVVSYLSSFI